MISYYDWWIKTKLKKFSYLVQYVKDSFKPERYNNI